MPALSQPKIRILDEKTINQIAAGEVIENASSVVKELIENSIDAGATEIFIETKEGGKIEIIVSDNGCGMSPDEAVLCLERHATSKISNFDDLHSLSTFGFRGEAIPSIASVSKMHILTSCGPSEEGTSISVEGGRLIHCKKASRNQGTTIHVLSLFFNVPARKKFQKSSQADASEIYKTIVKAALCIPYLRIQWKNDAQVVLDFFPKQHLFERVQEVFGIDYMKEMVPVEYKKNGYCLSGFISLPTTHRPNRSGQYVSLNKRPIISHYISQSVLEGYGTRLPTHRFPLFVLHVELPGEHVDVNVHPQKKEARLTRQEEKGEWVIEAIEHALQKRHADIETFKPNSLVSLPLMQGSEKKEYISEQIFGEMTIYETPPSYQQELFPEKSVHLIRKMGAYALVEINKDMAVVHLAAASARVFYEKASKKEKEASIQSLLFPWTFTLNALEMEMVKKDLSLLEEIGLHIRLLSGNTLVVDAIPQGLDETRLHDIIAELFSDLKKPKSINKEKILFTLCRANDKRQWSQQEIEVVVEQLLLCEHPRECPLGRETLMILTEEKWEKIFFKKPF